MAPVILLTVSHRLKRERRDNVASSYMKTWGFREGSQGVSRNCDCQQQWWSGTRIEWYGQPR